MNNMLSVKERHVASFIMATFLCATIIVVFVIRVDDSERYKLRLRSKGYRKQKTRCKWAGYVLKFLR